MFLLASLIAAQLVLGLAPARAQQASTDEAYVIRGVKVDVTAESAAAARDQALIAAQRSAFEELLRKIGRESDVAGLPPLGDAAISDMVLDFEIQSEQASTVRYIGELTFRFHAEPVRRYLERNGISYAVGSSRPALVLPVLTVDGTSLLWDDANAWLEAWSREPVDGPLVPIVVPLGDLADISAIDGPRALEGDRAALESIAQRYRAGEVLVAEAQPTVDPANGEARLKLSVRRYTSGGVASDMQDSLSVSGGHAALPDLYARAAQRVSDFLQATWRNENLVSSTVEQHLEVIAPIASLEEWVELRRRLADVKLLRRADLLALSRRQAEIDLVFIGDHNQLIQALAQRNLRLSWGAVGMPSPVPAAPPQTSGSVTVYPDAVTPTVPTATPQWELRMEGGVVPGSSTEPARVPAAGSAAPEPSAGEGAPSASVVE